MGRDKLEQCNKPTHAMKEQFPLIMFHEARECGRRYHLSFATFGVICLFWICETGMHKSQKVRQV